MNCMNYKGIKAAGDALNGMNNFLICSVKLFLTLNTLSDVIYFRVWISCIKKTKFKLKSDGTIRCVTCTNFKAQTHLWKK